MKIILQLFSESLRYQIAAVAIFFLGIILGGYTILFDSVGKAMLEQIEGIVEHIHERDSTAYMALYIFQNNVRAMLIMLLIGVLLFFVPMIMLFVNAVLLGYVLKLVAASEQSATAMLIYGIMPHGILELPAVIIAAGTGTFLGVRIIAGLYHLIMADTSKQHDQPVRTYWGQELAPVVKQRIRSVALLAISLVLVLFVAAYIEAYITPLLIERMILEDFSIIDS
jgi:stage II sporulation protein M